ncbi:adenylyl-sulfate kinase [Paraburkholderia sp. NMBU_R16]|uniref:adenylyl-sulfate kinase n=1 Tax=Paraburkholderia sp. NMBU_R16 TaxID=2698676 RepID=UPI0015672403|nr:adenylyl-sulfate kinase [Paraburkholderia sp. NMBU_R16]NRO98953.1 adenylyl-sulfate kinase [Paraburkholderia sp. NMBU_R16]
MTSSRQNGACNAHAPLPASECPHATDQFPPRTIWLTGLSGAGKSTLASHIVDRLRRAGRACHVLDGDLLREGLSNDLGFGRDDRREQVRRTAHVARILNEAGTIAVVALVSPYRADREMARTIIGSNTMYEVWVSTPLDVCAARDPKGLYRRANDGVVPGMTGIASPYEPPEAGALRIDTSQLDILTCVQRILGAIGLSGCANKDKEDACR